MLAIDITSASNDRFKTWKKVSASPRAIRKEGFTLGGRPAPRYGSPGRPGPGAGRDSEGRTA